MENINIAVNMVVFLEKDLILTCGSGHLKGCILRAIVTGGSVQSEGTLKQQVWIVTHLD